MDTPDGEYHHTLLYMGYDFIYNDTLNICINISLT